MRHKKTAKLWNLAAKLSVFSNVNLSNNGDRLFILDTETGLQSIKKGRFCEVKRPSMGGLVMQNQQKYFIIYPRQGQAFLQGAALNFLTASVILSSSDRSLPTEVAYFM